MQYIDIQMLLYIVFLVLCAKTTVRKQLLSEYIYLHNSLAGMSVPRDLYQVRVHRRVCACLIHGIGQDHASCVHRKENNEDITYNIRLLYAHTLGPHK